MGKGVSNLSGIIFPLSDTSPSLTSYYFTIIFPCSIIFDNKILPWGKGAKFM